MEYKGKSKALQALFEDSSSGGSGGNFLSRSAADVEELSVTTTYGTVKVMRMMIGIYSVIVNCQGMTGTQTTITTLPKKFWPKYNVFVSGQDDSAGVRGIGIKTDGKIIAYAGSTGMYATISYMVPVEWDYEVAPYYKSKTDEVVRKINNLGDDWQTFVVITDTHGRWNSQNSQDIVRYIVERTDAIAFWLGDCTVINWDDSGAQFNTFAAKLIPCSNKVYFALGNHDRATWDDLDFNDVKACYDAFLGTKDVEGNPSHYYYYFDVESRHTRYLVLNTSESETDHLDLTQTQLTWLSSAVQMPSSDWNLVVLGHIDINPNETDMSQTSHSAQAICTAIASTNGHIVGYFCGHQHIDQVKKIANAFYQSIFLCDCIDTRKYYPDIYHYPTRTDGTNTDQAVTVVYFNTTTGDVKYSRIGAYTKGTLIPYKYKEG